MSLADRIAKYGARVASASVAIAADERRWALRKSGIIAASIISDRLGGRVGCVVRDLSATGARLVLEIGRQSVIGSTSDIPATFKLYLERESVEVDCDVAWRAEKVIGVRFLSSMKHLPKRPPIRIGTPKKK